jgi:N utilization substance protein B
MVRGKSAYSRRKARVLALQVLYEVDLASHPVSASFERLKVESELPEDSSAYTLELIQGVVDQRDEIDEFIHKYAPAWPVKQLPVVDRNILRLALFEIHFSSGIPRKVAINEAVELAKTFGSGSSPRFVNGVLGSAVDELDIGGRGWVEAISTSPAEMSIISEDNINQEGK